MNSASRLRWIAAGVAAFCVAALLFWVLRSPDDAGSTQSISFGAEGELQSREDLELPGSSTSADGVNAPRWSRHPFLSAERNTTGPLWQSAGLVLHGRVVDRVGNALPDVSVALQLDTPVRGIGHIVEQIHVIHQGLATTRTNQEGEFRFEDLPDELLQLRAMRENGAQIVREGLRASRPNAEGEILVLRFEAGLELKLRYRDTTGLALAEHHLALIHNLEEGGIALRNYALTTDSDGCARISGLAPGRYTVVAFPAPQSISVLHEGLMLATDTSLELECAPSGRLEVLVHDASGAPIADAYFLALTKSADQGGAIYGTSDREGLIVIENAPLGRLNLCSVHAQGFSAWPATPSAAPSLEIKAGSTARLDVSLGQVRSATGLVMQVQSSTPLTDTELLFRDTSDPRGIVCARVKTDATGRFALNALPSGKLHLQVLAKDRLAMQPSFAPLKIVTDREEEKFAWDWVDVPAGEGPIELTIRVPASGSIAGRVVDAQQQPLPDVTVRLHAEREGFESRTEMRTDENGAFDIAGLHTPCRWNISLAAGNAVVSCEPCDLDVGEERNDLILQLPTSKTLQGRVLSRGLPVAEAWIKIRDKPTAAIELRSDADGYFSHPLRQEEVVVEVRAKDHMDWQGKAHTENGSFAPMEIELLAAVELYGEVRNELGAPLAGANLRWRAKENGPTNRKRDLKAVAASSGSFRMSIPDQPGTLHVHFNGYISTSILLDQPSGAASLDIKLREGLTISGHVMNSEGGPATSALVSVSDGTRPVATANAEADGSFVIQGLSAGSYTLEAQCRRTETKPSNDRASDKKEVLAGQRDVILTLLPGVALSGLVDLSPLDPSARQGIWIEARNLSGHVTGACEVGKDGAFEILGLEPGASVHLRIDLSSGAVRARHWGPYPTDQRNLYLQVSPGANLSGRIIDKLGQPLSQVQIKVYESEHLSEQPQTPPRTATTDGAGKFLIRGCSRGSLRLVLWRVSNPTRTQELNDVRATAEGLEITADL